VNLRTRTGLLLQKAASFLAPVSSQWTWWPRILESFTGAWQQNVVVDRRTVTENWAVFSCITLIAGDIAKMPATAMQFNAATKIYDPTINRPVLRKPNRYQTRIEFFRMWVFSLLLNGNTYILKQRNEQGFIIGMYILDPLRVTPLVSDDGGIYYQLSKDNLSQLEDSVVVPASEIIHDKLYTLYHPLVGVSPIYACGVAAMQGAAIQDNSAKFFQNMSRPSGVLTAPGAISDETAARLKAAWETNFSGSNIGKVAVLGDALKYEAMTISAVDSQLIEQLKFSGEMICATFHVPPYKLGLGPMPSVNNVAALNQQYYEESLQPITENMELHLTEGLELEFPFEVWMDESVLMRMDPATRLDSHVKAITGALKAPNEARREENLPPQVGGDVLYLQQQNYSLPALAKRDARDDPFSTASSASPPTALPNKEPEKQIDVERFEKELTWMNAA
jgi:HK97 family phage portal protein